MNILLQIAWASVALSSSMVPDTVPQQKRPGFHSDRIEDFRIADPTSGIPIMEAPVANNKGAAVTSLPFKLPPARQGMTPVLGLEYNSENGNSWTGMGWAIDLSEITVDTRWGVPRYDDTKESETYLLDGSQLHPVAHRSIEYEREADRTFHQRIEGNFYRIIRHGNSPRNYWWEITNKQGVVSYYGGMPEDGLIASAVLTDDNGNIAQWHLTKMLDPNGNSTEYEYEIISDPGVIGGTVPGRNIYPKTIYYNGHENERGPFSVHFITDRQLGESKRTDVEINARLGFKKVSADLLRQVEVRFQDQLVRSYRLAYETGAFFKTLLTSVSEIDSQQELFYTYEFDYYNEIGPEDNMQPFGAETTWPLPKDGINGGLASPIFSDETTILGAAKSSSFSIGSSLTAGPLGSLLSKENTLGPNYNFTKTDGEGLSAFVDINGDGLPDKVFLQDNRLSYRPNLLSDPDSPELFGEKRPINGISSFSQFTSTANAVGFEANPGVAFVGYTYEDTRTKIETYLADFNGDELMDICFKGTVYFNHINSNGDPEFTLSSADTPSLIELGAPIDASAIEVDPEEQQRLIEQFPLHDVVRMWEAPLSGVVSVTGDIQLIEDLSPESQAYQKKDGVRVAIQHNAFEVWNTTIAGDDHTPKTPANLNNLTVFKGDRIYFRVQSVFDGAYDQVQWDPVITYQNPTEVCDPNGRNPFRYRASEDYLLASCQLIEISLDGQVNIEGTFSKPVTSDDVTVSIIRFSGLAAEFLFTETIPWDSPLTLPIALNDLSVKSGESILFNVRSKTQINWSSLDWTPRMYYTSADDGSPVTSDDGNPLVQICPAVDYNMYNELVQVAESWIAPDSSTITANPVLPNDSNWSGSMTFSIKGKQQLLASRTFDIVDGNLPDNVALTTPVSAGDTLFFEFHTGRRDLEQELLGTTALIQHNEQQSSVRMGIRQRIEEELLIFGTLYRGWGQFIYNGNEGRANRPINESELTLENMEPDTALLENPDIDPEGLEGMGQAGDDKFLIMVAEPKSGKWRGSDALTFITAATTSSSRLGDDDIAPPSFASGGDGLSAPAIETKSRTHSIAGGALISGGAAWNDTETIIELTDMNGDRYPDIVTANCVQYTTTRGGLTPTPIRHGLGPHTASSAALGAAAGGSYIASGASNSGSTSGAGSNKRNSSGKARSSKKSKNSKNAFKAAEAGVGLSGSFNSDKDTTIHTWLDINGDGLEDKLYQNGTVRLNLGYRFAPAENWGFNNIRTGVSFDFGGGVGLNILNGSISAGISVAKSDNHSTLGMQDVNDDALVDLITGENPLKVRINQGNGFGPERTWPGTRLLDEGESVGESVNGAFTVCIPIFFFRVCVNPSGGTGRGIGKQQSQLSDINGDGYPDYLISEGETDLRVRTSNIGKTNLLRQIRNPLHGTIDLDYAIEGNTYGLPYSIWALQSTTVNDGLPGDGADVSKTNFSYAGGQYERHERAFLGFEEVRVHHLNTAADDAVYRTIVHRFNVDNFYTNGLLDAQAVLDADGKKYKETIYTHQLVDVATGAPVSPAILKSADGLVFPALVERKTIYYEGGDSLVVQTAINYEYDVQGNVIREIDLGNGTQADVLTTEFDYHDDEEKYFKSLLKEVRKYTAQGLRRHSLYSIDARGNITALEHLLEDGPSAVFSMNYDEFGNVIRLQRPANHSGDRLSIDYEFDPDLHQYPITETDGYGHVVSRKFEVIYGHETEEIGINGEVSSIEYDHLGRLINARWPFEHVSGQPYTIAMEYFPHADVPSAMARHYDAEHDRDITTYTFVDGLGRAVQTKQEATVYRSNGSENTTEMIVSGTENFDAFGRVVAAYHPITEPFSNRAAFNPDPDLVEPLTISYDVLDRPLEMVERDLGKATYEYRIANDSKGITGLLTHLTNANGHTSSKFFDTRGRLISTRQDSPEGDMWRHFRYNGLSELTTTIDHNDNQTNYTYDWLGRRTSVHYPDAGLTELKYDPVGNLRHRITSSIRDVISTDGSIRYTYDRERLIQIDYPKYFQNKVQIHYGSPGDSLNRVGRVWLLEDATGGREFFYDANGEITKTIRTIMVNRSNVFTFVWENTFDTWGRIQSMVYPDGEVVDFSYDQGGRLRAMVGEKLGSRYPYVDQLGYDKFGDRSFLKYGNQTITDYAYEAGKRRLQSSTTRAPGGKEIVDHQYEYDFLDNLIGQQGNATTNLQDDRSAFNYEYSFDEANRLEGASASWQTADRRETFETDLGYDLLNNITWKSRQHLRDNQEVLPNSFNFDYLYEHESKPHRPSEIGGRQHLYDANGNLLLSNSNAIFSYQQNLWDEENRLIATSDNGYISYYTYDAFSERAIKSHGGVQGIFIDGVAAGYINHQDNFSAYISPFFSYHMDFFTKHYFIGDERIATKVGTGNFNTNLFTGQVITAGGLDYKSRIQQYERSILDYFASLNIPPGPPTIPGYYAQPEINTVSLPNATNQNPYTAPPVNWPNLVGPPDTTGPPGIPVWFAPVDNATVSGGYGFEGFPQFYELEQFFYHYDQPGNPGVMTDFAGNVRQYASYFAQGDVFVSDKSGIESSPYYFQGLELDFETGMYYFGERYLDPRTGLWQSVDPRVQNFGELTYQLKPEGGLFFDYAGPKSVTDEGIDTEIINIERPDLIVDGVPQLVDANDFDFNVREAYQSIRDAYTKWQKKKRRQVQLRPGDPKSQAMLQQLYADLEAYDAQKKKNRQFELKPDDPKSIKTIRSLKRKLRVHDLKQKFKAMLKKAKQRVRIK